MFFSIIIPVFNAQQTLVCCLNSIARQTFRDYEVILIDDGSTDQSAKLCEEASIRDGRFQVIHQENRGPSAARNAGLKNAKGEYLCFIDSDDFICEDYLEQLHRAAEETGAGAIFFGYHLVDTGGRTMKEAIPERMDGERPEMMMKLGEQDLFGYTWIKCFSREAVSGIAFPEDMRLFEDEVFTCRVLSGGCPVTVLPLPLYNYVSGGSQMLTARTCPDYCDLSDRVYCAWKTMLQETDGCSVFFEKKANSFVSRCRYYGFEHDVEVRAFFGQLAHTAFFREHSSWSRVDRLVQSENWPAVAAVRMGYRVKQRLAKWTHGLRNRREN